MESNEEKKRRLKVSRERSHRAGLLFPVSRIERKLKKGRYANRISETAPVFLAAALEYLVSEVLELAGDSARSNGHQRITPRDVKNALHCDDELDKLTKDVIIPFAGGCVVKPCKVLSV